MKFHFLTILYFIATIGSSFAESIKYDVSGIVPNLTQPSDKTCWAAAATILVNWKESQSIPFSQVVARAGQAYVSKLSNNETLLGSEKPAFLNALHLKTEAPQNFTVKGWLSQLQTNGLLWVTTNEGDSQHFSVHARIVKGIFGDGSPDGTFLKIVDPADGSETSESYTTFEKKFESVAQIDLGQNADLRPQVVHF